MNGLSALRREATATVVLPEMSGERAGSVLPELLLEHFHWRRQPLGVVVIPGVYPNEVPCGLPVQ